MKLVIALDTEIKKAKKVVDYALEFNFKIFKIGHLLFDTQPEIINYITKKGGDVLLDLKFHDIPSVIVKAIEKILTKYKIWGFTIHSLGGKNLLKETKNFVLEKNLNIIIFAVTILTSLEEKDLKSFGFKTNIKNTILNLAKLAKNCGLDGVVCSTNEVEIIKKTCGKKFLTLVPGITIGNKNVDQRRTNTIENILSLAADYIVIGRSIYESENINTTLQYLNNLFLNNKK
ncbi:MAG: orotidine-5'-phosphate decarboxylase [Endomicrobiia bacterium]